ncbi:MAG: endo alpha-1,4 polygalactosaminidase [Nocardioidaceae bacterium]
MRTWLTAVVLVVSGLVAPAASATGPAAQDPTLPPTGTDFDYQLGGNAPLPDHVGIVVRDRHASPSDRAYSVCYVNGFQTQPDEKRFWKKHLRLVLHKDGRLVVDESWGEWVLDIRTAAKRQKLAAIMGRWVQGCADDGYEAVEFDNLDSFLRSKHLISTRQTKAYATLLVQAAHDAGLAAAQKNRAGWDGTAVGFDFAIAEECGRWHECGSYVDHYGDEVLVVEYRRKDFRRTCRVWGDRLAVVLRDLDLTPDGVHDYC